MAHDLCDGKLENELPQGLSFGSRKCRTIKYEVLEDPVCKLCPEALNALVVMVEHLHECHDGNAFFFKRFSNQILFFFEVGDRDFPECCDCQVGRLLQTNIINHILKHLQTLKFKTEDSETAVELENSQEDHRTKKPSYHRKFNRRERSPTTENLLKEFTQNAQSKMFHCNFCDAGYRQKQSAERHLSRAHDTRNSRAKVIPKSLFLCTICNREFRRKQGVEKHLEREHQITIANASLDQSLTKQEKLFVHQGEKPKIERKLTCDVCGRIFVYRETLRKHLESHFNASNKPRKTKEKIVCDQCTKLVNPRDIKRHILTHHSSWRPYRCEYPGCSTSYFELSKLQDHNNIHLNIKPYVCEFCDLTFHYASSLSQHKLRHLDPDRFKCEVCQQCLASTKALQMHMRLHMEKGNPDDTKPFTCSVTGCLKSFHFEDRLKSHIFNVHRVEGENKCEL